jgi:membrane protease YdiL (CAAX protease family)
VTIRWEWGLAVLAPLTVVFGLLVARQVAVVFVAYHLGICLFVPWLVARAEGRSWRRHLDHLGLGGGHRRLGATLAIALGAIPLAAFMVAPGLFPGATRLSDALAAWGVDPARPWPALLFLGVVNAPAEELFWRGWLQHRLGPGAGSLAGLVVLFASYHAVTIGILAPTPLARAAMLGGVLVAAAAWAWSRRRWGTIWPALASHLGASAGYVAVCLWILGRAS